MMQKIAIGKMWLALWLLSLPAMAQQATSSAETERRSFISAAEIVELMSKADAANKAGKTFNAGELLGAGYYHAVMQYLTGPMKAYAQHQDEDELFVVLDGAGEIILGAKLVNARPGAGATTLVADSGEGGVVRRLTKGDIFLLPAKSSRFVRKVEGRLVMMSMRLPHTDAAPVR